MAAAVIACRSSLVNTKSATNYCHHYIRKNASPSYQRHLQHYNSRLIITTKDCHHRQIMTQQLVDPTTNNNTTTIPLYVLGCGSIGLLLSASIRRAFPDYPITMLLRSHHRHRLLTTTTTADDGNDDDESTNVNGSSSSSSSSSLSSIRRDEKKIHHQQHYIKASITSPSNKTTFVTIPAEIINDDDEHYDDIIMSSSSPTNKENNIHHVLLCTKAPDASRAIKSILPRLAPQATITIVCNGALAVKDEICNSLPSSYLSQNHIQWIMASTTHGAHRHRNNNNSASSSSTTPSSLNHSTYHVTHAGYGTISVTHLNLSHLFSACGLQSHYVTDNDMMIELWRKLAVNAAVNPLTARDKCRNGDLFSCERRRRIMEEIVREVATVADRCCRRVSAVETTTTTKASSSSQELTTKTTTVATSTDEISSRLSFISLWKFVESVIQNTAENKSSMLQDVLAKRGPTEIDYLNGYVVRMGHRYGIETRANEEMCREIRALVETF